MGGWTAVPKTYSGKIICDSNWSEFAVFCLLALAFYGKLSIFYICAMIFQDIQHMDEAGSWHSTFQVCMSDKRSCVALKLDRKAALECHWQINL